GEYLPGYDYQPSLGELLVWEGAVRVGTTASTLTYNITNNFVGMNFVLKLIGSGFAFGTDGHPSGGTITAVQLYMQDGTSLLHSLTEFNRSLDTFIEAADLIRYDPWRFQKWLMAGNDTLNGLSNGSDELYGGFGDDVFNAGTMGSYMMGGAGTDTYNGNVGFDTITFDESYFDPSAIRGATVNLATGKAIDAWGNAETFSSIEGLRGTQFADTFVGSNAEYETFTGLGGADNIDGGVGFDVARYDRDRNWGGTSGVIVDLKAGYAFDGFGRKDTLKNIEGVDGTIQADKIYGSGVYNELRGFFGNDWLDGRGGGDSLVGGEGDDTYVIDSVNDVVDESRDNISGIGIDTVRSTVSVDFADTEHFRGKVENIVLLGSDGLNAYGNTLKNMITGNAGANRLRGADGDDTISGGAGDDKISGGRGNDMLAGNTGADTYYFSYALSEATNVDTIKGFSSIDLISLSSLIFTKAGPVGALAESAFVANADGWATTADHRIIYETDTGILRYDRDGIGGAAAIKFAIMDGNTSAINAGDFVIA
ncbi:MAG: calcium-binding protein, partial [Rhizobiaceae bacterium]|nr:calcium-binding protein [Rhizobiaceae bacterium]